MSNPPPRCYFAAVHAPDWLGLSAAEWDAVAECGITGIDVRISVPRSGPSKAERDLARRVREAGLEVRVHGWVGKLGPEGYSVATYGDGVDQGEWMGGAGAELQATVVGMNSENHVWRYKPAGNGRHFANPHADDFYRGLHVGSLRTYPTGLLQDVGYADPREHYVKADLDGDGVDDRLIVPEVAALFDIKGAMAYPGNAEVVKRKLARAREVSGPTQPLSWWGGVGRPSPTEGVVGSYETTLRGCRERWSGIDEWVGYVGFTERGQKMPTIRMLVDGHETHGPLVQLVRQICGKVV